MDMEITFPGGKKVEARYKGFRVLTDQPETSGGGNEAPAPFDLFVLSVGTCGAYYVLAFCQARDIPTGDIRVTLATTRDPERSLLSRMDLKIHLPREFPEKYVSAVAKAAKACAVVRHLENAPSVGVEVVRG